MFSTSPTMLFLYWPTSKITLAAIAHWHFFDYSGLKALCTTPYPQVGYLVCVQ
jgi:hypothetical protein